MPGVTDIRAGRLVAVLVGMIQTTETRQFDLEGDSLEELYAAAAAVVPDGWVTTLLRPIMQKGSTHLKGTVTARRHELAEVEGDSIDALRASVPDGWQLVSVRTA